MSCAGIQPTVTKDTKESRRNQVYSWFYILRLTGLTGFTNIMGRTELTDNNEFRLLGAKPDQECHCNENHDHCNHDKANTFYIENTLIVLHSPLPVLTHPFQM